MYIKKKDKEKYEDPKIMILKDAYTKLNKYSTAKNVEIMLFGIVDRKDNIYTITDFIVPPQTSNSGVFVTTHDKKYAEWLQNMPREERQKLRLHYHTHPKMGTSPSGTDQETIQDKVENINDFYIRMIGNEKQEFHIDLFDMANKMLFEEMSMYLFLEDYTIMLGKHEPEIITSEYKSANKELDEQIFTNPNTPTNYYSYTYSGKPYTQAIQEKEIKVDPYTNMFADILARLENEENKYPSKKLKQELKTDKYKDVRSTFSITDIEWSKLERQEYIDYIDEYLSYLYDMRDFI